MTVVQISGGSPLNKTRMIKPESAVVRGNFDSPGCCGVSHRGTTLFLAAIFRFFPHCAIFLLVDDEDKRSTEKLPIEF